MKFPKIIDDSSGKEDSSFPHLYDFDEIETLFGELPPEKTIHTLVPAGADFNHAPRNEVELIGSKYPRIIKTIEMLWGTQELQNKFTRWLLTDQDDRQGWPNDVYKALFELSSFHSIAFSLEGKYAWDDGRDKW